MIYAQYSTSEMYVFDKYGEWHDEGVDHPGLSLDSTFSEQNWYDEFSPEEWQ